MPMVGSVSSYTTPNGSQRWRFQGPPAKDIVTGEPIRTSGVFKTHDEALQACIDYNAAIGNLEGNTKSTLETAATYRLKESTLAFGTRKTYEKAIKGLPEWLRHTPMGEVDRPKIEKALHELIQRSIQKRKKTLSRSSIDSYLNVISMAFTFLESKNVKIHNHAKDVAPKKIMAQYATPAKDWKASIRSQMSLGPTTNERVINQLCDKGPVLSRDDLLRLFDAFEDPYSSCLQVMFLQGLRRAEALGLQWNLVELSPDFRVALIRNTITVWEGEYHVTDVPKAQVERPSFLADRSVSLIQAQMTRQQLLEKDRVELPDVWRDDWVFTAPSAPRRAKVEWYPGRHLNPDTLTKMVSRWCKKEGIDADGVRVLRRTWATMAARLKIDLHVIIGVLGHAGGTIAQQHYTVATPAEMFEAVNRVAAYVWGELDLAA